MEDLTRGKPSSTAVNHTLTLRQFDSLGQTPMGFNHAEAEAYAAFKNIPTDDVSPKPLPMQALDHAAGYFLAFGINAALCKSVLVSQPRDCSRYRIMNRLWVLAGRRALGSPSVPRSSWELDPRTRETRA